MKAKVFKFLPLVCGLLLAVGLVGCDPVETTSTSTEPGPNTSTTQPGPETHVVSYYDGETVIHTENVVDGETAPEWDPTTTITDKQFFGWFGEPTLTHEYDFTLPVTDDLSIFGSFVGYQDDTRHWALAGSGATELLRQSNWGVVYTDAHYMEDKSTSEENIFVMEINLFVNDQFQFTNPVYDEETETYSWGHQRGGGYLVEPTRDGVEYFSVGGGLGTDNYTSNITALVEGRYRFTLTTYPAGDFQKDDSPETYNNRNYYDTLEWERIGESTEVQAETTTQFYLKGEFITAWADLKNDHTLMVETDGVHTLNNVYLKAADQFMFASIVTDTTTGETSVGNEYIRGSNLSEESKTLVTGESNMKVVEDGYYNFSYDYDTKTLTVTKNDSYVPAEASYYVDGNFGGRSWGIDENYKLVASSDDPEVYELSAPITVSAAGEQIGIQYYNAELTSPYVDFFGSAYVAVESEAYDLSATNISFNTPGSYNISINTYSHIITITVAE